MIAKAYERNPLLVNIKSISGDTWCMDGVMGGDGENRDLTPIEANFCKIMDIKADRRVAENASIRK